MLWRGAACSSLGCRGWPRATRVFLGWRSSSERRVIMCAPTHVATRNMICGDVESITIQRLHHRFLKYGTFDPNATLVVDEISQVNTSIWHAIVPLVRYGVQIICMGNPDDQLLSVQDSWMDTPLAVDVSDGTLLKGLCSYKRLRLTDGKLSCHALFDFYASCSTMGDRYHLPLDRMLAEARLKVTNKGFGDVNLVISHRRRIAIKQKVQATQYRKAGPMDVL
ncbi:AAA family ATPase [bacterium]|nr:AAA family ATPase [bacterium]